MFRVARGWPRAAVPVLAAALMATGAMAAPASAQDTTRTIQVNSTTDVADEDPTDGECDTGDGATCTLRAAVMEADGDDEHTDITIEVPAGTYELTEDGTADSGADSDLYLSDDAKPGDTSYTIVGVDGTPVIDATALHTGPNGQDGTDRVLRVVDDADETVLDVTLRDLELTGGNPRSGEGEGSDHGGAILVEGTRTPGGEQTSLVGDAIHVHGNRAHIWGGAISSHDAQSTISDSRLNDNAAPLGGAVYTGSVLSESHLTMDGTEVVGNEAHQGGGIWAAEDDVIELDDVTFRDNHATDSGEEDPEGGAIWIRESELTVVDSTFTGNQTRIAGGAIYNDDGTMFISGSAFTSNAALCECVANGGAIWTTAIQRTTTYIAGSSFVGNRAIGDGGAIFIGTDDVHVTNSTFTDNGAREGGAIMNHRGWIDLVRSTVARNHAWSSDTFGGSGGGIRAESTDTHLENVVIAENTVGVGEGEDESLQNCGQVETGYVESMGHNVSDDATCFTDGEEEGDQASVNAELGTLEDAATTDVIPLLPSSPAIDVGSDEEATDACPVADAEHADEVDNDQRGEPAPVDGDIDGTIACDAGAYEFQPNVVTVADTTDGSEAGPTDGAVTLARSGDELAAVTVDYTVDGTATPGSDYETLSGSATFPAGETTTVVPVEVLVDDEDEDAETVELTLADGDGYLVGSPDTGTVTIADDAPDATERLAGDDRVDTAVLVSQRSFPDGSDVVVIARSDVYADALAGGPYAHQVDAPILVTPPTQLRDEVAAEIDRLGATQAVILGGPLAISPDVQDELEDEVGLSTARLEGPDRFATAADIADEIGGDEVYVTEGTNSDATRGWPDAVSVAPLAAHQNHPILFVRSDLLPDPTRAQLQASSRRRRPP